MRYNDTKVKSQKPVIIIEAEEEKMDFLLCILQYLLIMAVLAAIGALGAFIGIRMRKNKNAKAEAAASEADE